MSGKTIIAALILWGGFFSAIAQIQRNAWINFYGKVVDQDNQPIPGVVIKLVIAADPSEDNVPEEKDYTTETGEDGKFSLIGAVGCAMQIISITKPGYELSKKAKLGYPYLLASDIYHPDMHAPVLFKMWKSVGKEALIGFSWHGKVACDGTTNRFDLKTGKPSDNGDLEIVCSKHPLTVPPPGNAHFDYKFEIAVIDGGIQATTDDFTYRAPESGYLPVFVKSQKASDPQWYGGIKQDFYIETKNGRFGRIYVEWYASQTPPVYLELDCSINPSGSRNLER